MRYASRAADAMVTGIENLASAWDAWAERRMSISDQSVQACAVDRAREGGQGPRRHTGAGILGLAHTRMPQRRGPGDGNIHHLEKNEQQETTMSAKERLANALEAYVGGSELALEMYAFSACGNGPLL
jgi:hypothetical protein